MPVVSQIAPVRRIAATVITCILCACSASTDATPIPTSTPSLVAVRPTFTPWPTPEIRDDQRLTLESRINEAADPQADKSLTVRAVQATRNATGDLEVLGAIVNNVQQAQSNVQVRIQLRSANGEVLAKKTILAARNVIGGGQISPFRVHFSEPPAELYGIDIVAIPGTRMDSQPLAMIETDQVVGVQDGTRLTVSGTLVNREPPIVYTIQPGDSPLGIATRLGISLEQIAADNPNMNMDLLPIGTALTMQVVARNLRVLAIAYDSQKRVIGYRYTDVPQSVLPSSGSIPFTTTVLTTAPTIAAFEVIAEGVK
jgi:hypothetical protein